NLQKIAVVGPNADDKATLLANYYGYPSKITTVLEGIKKKTNAKIIYEKGLNVADNEVFKSNYQANNFSFGGKAGFQAEYFKNTKLEGKPLVVRTEQKINYQFGDGEQVVENIIANEYSARWTSNFTTSKTEKITFELKGDDKAKLFVDGEKRIETDLKNGYYTFDAQAGKTYKIVIEYVQSNDNAEVKFDVGFIEKATPETIASRVKLADVIVFVGGISAKLEGEAMPVNVEGFKGGDRTNIELPKVQTELLKALKATGKPIVFVNMSGGAMGFEWEATNLPAIVQAWYAGQSGGEAIADVLFGVYNPSGKLPITFYKNISQLPDFEDYSMDNRTYRYFKGEPIYHFGHGLSYSNFQYKNLQIRQTKHNELAVSVTVKNSGNIDGDEITQLYLANKKPQLKAPKIALKGFERIHLKAGESKRIAFKLYERELSEIDEKGKSSLIKDSFELSVGGSQPTEDTIKMKKIIQKTFQLGLK
ncbi:MAG: hypothetical protein RLZZ306_2955, partial [Bacteroidota bacterium]